jgi:hypothetical protein
MEYIFYFFRLHGVKMDGGVEDETGVELYGIERCSCPASYTGYSCEASIDYIFTTVNCDWTLETHTGL